MSGKRAGRQNTFWSEAWDRRGSVCQPGWGVTRCTLPITVPSYPPTLRCIVSAPPWLNSASRRPGPMASRLIGRWITRATCPSTTLDSASHSSELHCCSLSNSVASHTLTRNGQAEDRAMEQTAKPATCGCTVASCPLCCSVSGRSRISRYGKRF